MPEINYNRITNTANDSADSNGYRIIDLKDLKITGPVYCDSIFPDNPKEGQRFHTEMTDYTFRNGAWWGDGDDMGIPACVAEAKE